MFNFPGPLWSSGLGPEVQARTPRVLLFSQTQASSEVVDTPRRSSSAVEVRFNRRQRHEPSPAAPALALTSFAPLGSMAAEKESVNRPARHSGKAQSTQPVAVDVAAHSRLRLQGWSREAQSHVRNLSFCLQSALRFEPTAGVSARTLALDDVAPLRRANPKPLQRRSNSTPRFQWEGWR